MENNRDGNGGKNDELLVVSDLDLGNRVFPEEVQLLVSTHLFDQLFGLNIQPEDK